MLRVDQDTMDRAEKTGLPDGWLTQAERDPIAARADRLARSALSWVAIDDPGNQAAILPVLHRRGMAPARFAAFQVVLFDSSRHEDLRRHQSVTPLQPCQPNPA